jgi:N-carbamoyl-L-amino-acid hydrolase
MNTPVTPSEKSRSNLPVNQQRLWDDLMALAEITEPDRKWTRRAFSPRFLEGRDWLVSHMQDAGLEVRLDTAGNLIGRRKGSRPGAGAIVLGSHTDTVPDGGRFDGPAGVLAGLEVARALLEAGVVLEHDLEVIDCLAEEVSPYGLSCVGSRAISGTLDEVMLARQNADGEALIDGIRRMGGHPDRLAEARRSDIAAYLELHIEQGTVLESAKLDIGVVTAISGITRFEVIVEGRPDHAGTTVMTNRLDALVAASDMVLAIRADAVERAKGPAHFAATVGEFEIEPNAANVVPSRARLLIDTRAERREDMEAFADSLGRMVAAVAARHGVTIAPPRRVSDNPPTPSAEALMQQLEGACDRLGAGHRRMASGAGHDMAWFARVAPAAMIFIPCLGGRSHCAEEWTEPHEVAMGAAVLLETVKKIDAALP